VRRCLDLDITVPGTLDGPQRRRHVSPGEGGMTDCDEPGAAAAGEGIAASGTPTSEPGAAAVEKGIAGSGTPGTRRWTVRRLPALVLLFAVVVAAVVGLEFKSLANPPKEDKTLESQPPQTIGVYVSNPNISVQLTVQILGVYPAYPIPLITVAGLYLTVEAPASLEDATVLITSSLADTTRHFIYMPFDGLSGYGLTASVRTVQKMGKTDTAGALLGVFNLRHAEQDTKGSFFAHLPLVSDFNSFYPLNVPPLLSVLNPRTGRVINLLPPVLKKV
jgi:hypothetical protein